MSAKYKVLIADDEKLARESIKILLQGESDCEIVAESENGVDALSQIQELQPNIVFLDIQMPNLQGLEVIESLKSDIKPVFIMVTAFDHYAVKAFDLNAVDYLLKPYSDKRFKQSLEKAKNFITSNSTNEQFQLLKNTLSSITMDQKSKLVIKSAGKYELVSKPDIRYIKASGNYCEVHSSNRKHLMYSTISALENGLNPGKFVRIHRSIIVNIDYIKELESHLNGEFIVHLESGEQLKLSRGYKHALDSILEE